MKTFLEEVVSDLVQRTGWERMGDYTIVVPSRRAALTLKQYIKNAIAQAGLSQSVQLPKMTTLIDLMDSLSGLYRADEIYLVTVLYRVYREVLRDAQAVRHTSLATFFTWGKQLVLDFSSIDKAYPIVTARDFLSNTAAARQLEQLDIDDEVRERLMQLVGSADHSAQSDSKRAVFEAIWNHLCDIYTRYQEALGNRSYEGARMRQLLEQWDDASVQSRLQGTYVFAGFNYLVPAEQEFLQRLKDSNRALFYWEYPDSFTANSHAFRWIQRNAERFGNALPPHPWQQGKEVEVVSTASSWAQAQYVWNWLYEHHHAGETSAVVICDEQMLEQVIYALPGNEEERFTTINITKGFPMRRTAIYADILAWLTDKANDRQNAETYVEVLSRLITYVEQQLPQSPEQQEEEITLSWHELLRGESVFQAYRALIRFRSLMTMGVLTDEVDSLRTLRLLLRRQMEGLSFPFHGEPITPIQITGMLETRALDFDNVLLLNVEEGIVPNASADRSYLPYYLRKRYGLLTHEESTDVYAYNFFRLMHRAKYVTALFCGSESKNNRRSMSRFLRQMMTSEDFLIHKYALTETNTVREVPTSLLPEKPFSLYDLLHKDAEGYLCREDGHRLTVSPSAIDSYITCPLLFYLRYVLGIPEPEDLSLLWTRAEIGSLTHETLLNLYRTYGLEGRLGAINERATEAAIADAMTTLNAQQPEGKRRFTADQHPLELTVVRRYVRRILDADLQLSAQTKLEIVALEEPCRMTLDIGEAKVQVGGRIDRVDKVGGLLRIVDYKTGKGNDKKLHAETMESLFEPTPDPSYLVQTLTYCAAYVAQHPQAQPTPYIYFPGRKTEDVVHSLSIGTDAVQYAQHAASFIDQVSEQVKRLLHDSQPVAAKKCAKFCPFMGICGKPQ